MTFRDVKDALEIYSGDKGSKNCKNMHIIKNGESY